MKRWIDIVSQGVLGLVFFVFGLNGFFHFLETPEVPSDAGDFLGALAATGYFIPFLKIVETVSGLLLLVRKFPALALLLLAPIVVHIFLFHAFLAPGGLPLAVVIVVLEAYLGFFVYRDRFREVLRP